MKIYFDVCSPAIKDLISGLLNKVKDGLTAEEARNHELFTGIKPKLKMKVINPFLENHI